MKVLGITGGIGCGKSEVLRILKEEYGAEVCQLDEVAKQLQKKGGVCYRQILELFGEEILGVGGELNRDRLAQIVFSDEKKLSLLNGIVHPEVKEWVRNEIFLKEQEGRTGLYVIEAALLPAAGYEAICDEMWYIYAEDVVRRRRLADSRGYTEEKITQIIRSQPDEPVFRSACTAVIDNSQDLNETRRQIKKLLQERYMQSAEK